MYHLVIRPLHKGAVYVAKGYQPLRSHPRRKRDGMLLCYPYIEGTIGHGRHHYVHRASRRHGRGHPYYPFILLCQLHQRMAKYILKLRSLRGTIVLLIYLPSHLVELARCMPLGLVFLRGAISFALHCQQVQELWPWYLLHVVQHLVQVHHIVAIYRSKVAQRKRLK